MRVIDLKPTSREGLGFKSPSWADNPRLNFVSVNYYEKEVAAAQRHEVRLIGTEDPLIKSKARDLTGMH